MYEQFLRWTPRSQTIISNQSGTFKDKKMEFAFYTSPANFRLRKIQLRDTNSVVEILTNILNAIKMAYVKSFRRPKGIKKCNLLLYLTSGKQK